MKRLLSVSEKAVLSREGVIKSAVKRYLGNDYSEYVDDAVQDILCKALERISSYSSKMGSMDSWLYTISKNYCFDLMEKRSNNLKWRVQLEDVDGLTAFEGQNDPDTEILF
jgi:DNA-directed RNA polymerase specialized sigma24 family protein